MARKVTWEIGKEICALPFAYSALALRDGAPFIGWELPEAMEQIKDHYMRGKGGDREFVDLRWSSRNRSMTGMNGSGFGRGGGLIRR